MARVRMSLVSESIRSRVNGLEAADCRSTIALLTRKCPALMSQGGCGGTHSRRAWAPRGRSAARLNAAQARRRRCDGMAVCVRAGDGLSTPDVQLGKLAFYP